MHLSNAISHDESQVVMPTPEDLHLSIPRSVAEALALPENRKEGELRRELALALYREEMLSFGKARELAQLDPYRFAQLLGDRGIERHYGPTELEEDQAYARGSDR